MNLAPIFRFPVITASFALGLLPFSPASAQAADPQPSPAPATAAQPSSQTLPPRIKRADAFFGLHFDFHARETDTAIGKTTTRAMIERVIDQVHPDYLQIDCKGHKGFSSYPTQVGFVPTAGITGDTLKLWREVTAERGISLIMHYSGVIDLKAVQTHPDWSVMSASGEPAGRSTSLFGPYKDKLMLPQFKELALTYGVDGLWIDGDCWGVEADYSPAALAAFTQATGIKTAPRSVKDPHWQEWMQFHRATYRRYLHDYVTEIKKFAPHLQVAVNAVYSDYMPEPVAAPVDFLSMDIVPIDTLTKTRVSPRYFAGLGIPWDMMSWGFNFSKESKDIRIARPVADLKKEAAKIIAFGGGYEVYLKQERDGSITQDLSDMAELAKFCRERQAFCHRAQQVPQVAVLLSTAGFYQELPRAFKKNYEPYLDTLKTLIFSKYSVELLGETRLSEKINDYPLVVIPNWAVLNPGFKEKLLAYVEQGGHVILVGPKPTRLFQTELDLTVTETAPAASAAKESVSAKALPGDTDTDTDASDDKPASAAKAPVFKITRGPKAELFDIKIKSPKAGASTEPGASFVRIGKGRLAAVYEHSGTAQWLTGIAQRFFPEPLVELDRGGVEIVINRINGNLAINLLTVNEPRNYPLAFTVRQPTAPAKVTLQPANTPIPFKFADGKLTFTTSIPEIHSIVVIE